MGIDKPWRIVSFVLAALLLIVTVSFLGVALTLQSQLTSFCHDDRTRSGILREFLRSDAALQKAINKRATLTGDFWSTLADQQDGGTLRRFLASDSRLVGDENVLRANAGAYWRQLLTTVPATHC